MRYSLCLILCFSLMGCVAFRYSKPGGTTEMVNADMNACIKDIERTKPRLDLSGGGVTRDAIDACLAQKGWTRDR